MLGNARVILDERKRREIDPTVSVLRECLRDPEGKGPAEIEMRERLKAMLEFVEMLTSLFAQSRACPRVRSVGCCPRRGIAETSQRRTSISCPQGVNIFCLDVSGYTDFTGSFTTSDKVFMLTKK